METDGRDESEVMRRKLGFMGSRADSEVGISQDCWDRVMMEVSGVMEQKASEVSGKDREKQPGKQEGFVRRNQSPALTYREEGAQSGSQQNKSSQQCQVGKCKNTYVQCPGVKARIER